MAPADDFSKETRDDYSSKNIGRDCGIGFGAFAATSPAQALTAQECSAKYQAAKTAGTLAGQKWNDFRKAQCGRTLRRLPPLLRRHLPRPGRRRRRRRQPSRRRTPSNRRSAGCTAGPAVFPIAVDPKYSKETAGKARMHTCADQWKANKATQRQWRHEVDPEGRRLLERMQQEAEGRGLTSDDNGARPGFRPRPRIVEQFLGRFAISCARLRGPRSRNSRLWPKMKQ